MENCYKQLKLFLLIFALVMLAGGKAAAALPSMLPASGGWTDSLRVSVVDSFVEQKAGENYLRFTIVVERKNADWNNQDTVLGNSDLYFFANLAAFDGDPEFVDVHDSLFVSAGASIGSSLARLQISGRQWAGRMQIALTRRDEGNDLLNSDRVPVEQCPYLLRLTLNKPDTLCKVKWKLRKPMAVNTGIVWDAGRRGATGLQSLGGNPILEDLSGEIPTIPTSVLNVDPLPESFVVCEGSALEVAVHAEATGDGPEFAWYDSIPGKPAHFIDPTKTQQQYTESGKNYSYSYRFSAAGDTLYIDQVPGCMDSVYFACVVSAPSIGATPVYTVTRLYVRDSIWGFISPASDALSQNTVDTVTFCEGEEGVAVRFNIFGPSVRELNEVDSIWFEYRKESADGYLEQDTMAFKVPDDLNSTANPNKIDGYSVFWFPVTIKATGKLFINRIWTKYCENAVPAAQYDSIYIKQGTFQMLERLNVMAGGSIIMDSVNSPWFATQKPASITTLRNLGTVPNGPLTAALPFRYQARDTFGLDTVVYKMNIDDKCSWLIREVEVQNLKYMALKVLLEGPRLKDDSMRCLLRRVALDNADAWGIKKNFAKSHFVSPYQDSLRTMIEVKRMREIVEQVPLVDWISIRLRKVASDGDAGDYVDTLSCFLRGDGIVCDTAGNPYISFKNLEDDEYYVVIRHRNHISIMSDVPVKVQNIGTIPTTLPGNWPFSGTACFLDLSDKTNVRNSLVPGAPNPDAMAIINGIGYMYAGDTDGDNIISSGDINKTLLSIGSSNGPVKIIYDFTFDGAVTRIQDLLLVRERRSFTVKYKK